MNPTSVARFGRRLYSQLGSRLGLDSLSGLRLSRRDDLRELGAKGGSWVIPTDRLNSGSVCYCVGCGEDISFDLSLMQSIGCEVHGFDPTPRAIRYVTDITRNLEGYHFNAFGLWSCDDQLQFFAPREESHVSHSLVNLQRTTKFVEVPVRRLSGVMQDNGHDHIDLLKLDIEGAEYAVIDSILQDELEISVLCVEFDEFWNPLDRGFRHRIRDRCQRLASRGYQLVDFRGNGNYTFLLEDGGHATAWADGTM